MPILRECRGMRRGLYPKLVYRSIHKPIRPQAIPKLRLPMEGMIWMRVLLAQPRGFCAGVVRAIDIVSRSLEKYGPPVYVRHEIVHNRHVVETLKAKGARFVEDLSDLQRAWCIAGGRK